MATYKVQQQHWTHWPKVLIVEQYATLENLEIGVAYGRYVPEQRVTDLKADNDQLRQQLADVAESMGRVEKRCVKLRELVRDMWTFTQLANVCGRLSNGSAWNADEFRKRMRELGVEVGLHDR